MNIIFGAVGICIIAAAIIFIPFENIGSGQGTQDTFIDLDNIIPLPQPDFNQIIPLPPEDPTEIEVDTRPRSILTGLPIYEEYITRRPVAVVINNIRRALPQSGIASADIIYEVLSEGDITRLIGIFQSEIPDEIGPVRSARDYFVDFAFNHDAFFVHHGASPTGYTRIRGQRIDSVDGIWAGALFWRDRTYPYWAENQGTRPLEHSSYTAWYRLSEHFYNSGARDYMNDDPAYGFIFGEIPVDAIEPLGIAERVVVPFSANYTRIFMFDETTGLYNVENPAGAHVDALDQTQIAVANVLIQRANMRVIDAEGRRSVDTIGAGYGYLITLGQYFPVRWEKESHVSPMRWYFMNDEPIVLTPGVTWICVFQANGAVTIETFDPILDDPSEEPEEESEEIV